MKLIPNIEFRVDTSIEYGYKIDRLLKEISDSSDSHSRASRIKPPTKKNRRGDRGKKDKDENT